jgi:hypothetical protein
MRRRFATLTACLVAALLGLADGALGAHRVALSSRQTQTEPGQSKMRRISAEGTAPIASGNVESARLGALRVAYADAVAHGSGVVIGSLALAKNVRTVTNVVTSKSRGFVKSYRIVREGIPKDNPAVYQVQIEAEVVDEDKAPEGDLTPSLAAYLELLGKPKLLVVLPERRSGSGAVTEGGEALRNTEAAVGQAFSHQGYEIVTSDDLVVKGLCTREVRDEARAGVTAKVIEAGRAASADLALVGVVRVAEDSVRAANVDLKMVTAEVAAKAIVLSSGKVIDLVHRAERASSMTGLKAYSDCMDAVAAGLTETVGWQIPRILTEELRETTLEVRGVSPGDAVRLKIALEGLDGVEDVRVVQVPDQQDGSARYVLESGFIFVEPPQVLDCCVAALRARLTLVNANKYGIQCAVARR